MPSFRAGEAPVEAQSQSGFAAGMTGEPHGSPGGSPAQGRRLEGHGSNARRFQPIPLTETVDVIYYMVGSARLRYAARS